MKSKFPWNMALLYCSRVLFQSSRCCFQASQPVYPLLRMWQWRLDERFTLRLATLQIISRQTPTLPYLISPRDDDSTRSIHLKMRVVLAFKDPHGLIWPMIVTRQKWFTIFNLLIQDPLYLAVQLSREGLHHRDYYFVHLRSHFSKPSVLLHLILLWWIDETYNKIIHKGNTKSDHWHHS